MDRKKLSLRLKAGDAGNEAVLSDEIITAQTLLETHGPRPGQVLVDEAQAAIKAGDDSRASFLERVRVAMMTIM
ncbi:hypothetical protein SUS17_2853 [Sphingomonas sp. S17]|uniref:hypothetical protein n=1 Tax=Sphingomonadales TaxID=204457 RepID=UPI00020A2989|nr:MULTISPECIES: hypothetical protein [Sphingomonadaceae]AVA14986.1 hypothetical protein C3E99_15000 [Sphingopyxis sp. MG]EGI54346.1 hypothetical protein SUS17_2853 [Sphingomonas sp. S17]